MELCDLGQITALFDLHLFLSYKAGIMIKGHGCQQILWDKGGM